MIQKKILLRALEPSDLEELACIENDQNLWKFSNRNEPYSKHLLARYIEQQHQDIFEVRQKRCVISNSDADVLGFVDLFDFEPLHRRAGVGLVVKKEHRQKGIGLEALQLLIQYTQDYLNIHCLFANIASENQFSIQLFESCGFHQICIKKDWNFYDRGFHDEYLYQKLFN